MFVSKYRRKFDPDGERNLATAVTSRLVALRKRVNASRPTRINRLPIRLRLAVVSASLTFVILCAFAVVIGSLTTQRIRTDFSREVSDEGERLPAQLGIHIAPFSVEPPLVDFAAADHAVIRILALGENVIAQYPKDAPSLGPVRATPRTLNGYLVTSHLVTVRLAGTNEPVGEAFVQYGRRLSSTEATVRRVELLLFLGVLVGSGLALLAGMAIARRAMAPITELTNTAAEIARTRDPSLSVPQSLAEDEVADLARTLEGMLRELDAAREETESVLVRQRQFVADASHELRTPLTSILANLELLAESLHGDEGEVVRSAVRTSRRMRRLVADLLFLARADVAPTIPTEPCNIGQVVIEAAAELGPIAERHDITLDTSPFMVLGSHDELLRLTINLLENAVRHTPPGTKVRASTAVANGQAELVVEDDGPGVPQDLVPTLFERFVRGAGDRGGSFGLGLAVVQAIVKSYGGTVTLEDRDEGTGARFTVRLPTIGTSQVETPDSATA